jgi:predicted DNA-binding protein (MmcQ/YjbR family)
MTYDDYNAFCASLPATSHVVQWGGSHVWKVGGKVFAIGGWDKGQESRITFKVSDIAYEVLKDRRGLRPAPYLASRGMKWIQHHAKPGLSDKALKDYLRESHRIVAAGLSKKKQDALFGASGAHVGSAGGRKASQSRDTAPPSRRHKPRSSG